MSIEEERKRNKYKHLKCKLIPIIFGIMLIVILLNFTSAIRCTSNICTLNTTLHVTRLPISEGGGTTGQTGWITTTTNGSGTQIVILSNFSNITLYSMELKYLGVSNAQATIKVLTKDVNGAYVDVETVGVTSNTTIDYKVVKNSVGNYDIRIPTPGIAEDIIKVDVTVKQLSKEITQNLVVDLSAKQSFFSGITGNTINGGEALKQFVYDNWIALAMFFFVFVITIALIVAFGAMGK